MAESTEQKRRVALITGITGQDGSYLAEFLLDKGYIVHGIIRRSSTFNTGRLKDLFKHERLILHHGDLTDSSNLVAVITAAQPDEVYNLAAQSHVKVSFEMPEYTAEVDALGTLRLLDCLKSAGLQKKAKFYQASTSELYGGVRDIALNEDTPFYPRSPYAVAKLYAYWAVINYREAYGIFAVNGILFNHESPRRGPTFVTRKITRAVAAIDAGKQKMLQLGNLDALRDWGHARDYVKGMWLMLQQDKPSDYVLATGEKHSVREFVEKAFACTGREIEWRGQRGTVEEKGHDKKTGEVLVAINPRYFRPTEVDVLLGDCTKAKTKLGWTPDVKFEELVKEMVASDRVLVKSDMFEFL